MSNSLPRFVNASLAFVIGLGLTSWALLSSQEEEIQFQAEHKTWFETQDQVRLLLQHQAELNDFLDKKDVDAFGWLDLHFGAFNPHNSDGLAYQFPTNSPESTITITRGDLLSAGKTSKYQRRLYLIPSEDGHNVLVRGILSGDTVFRSTLPLPR